MKQSNLEEQTMKLIPILDRSEGRLIGHVDERTTLATIRHDCPGFFRNRTGQREAYTMHRGQLIVRGTVKFTGCRPERKTCVYLYFVDGDMENDTLCISAGGIQTTNKAKALIDRVLKDKTYNSAVFEYPPNLRPHQSH